jgi:hypothetical protein
MSQCDPSFAHCQLAQLVSVKNVIQAIHRPKVKKKNSGKAKYCGMMFTTVAVFSNFLAPCRTEVTSHLTRPVKERQRLSIRYLILLLASLVPVSPNWIVGKFTEQENKHVYV